MARARPKIDEKFGHFFLVDSRRAPTHLRKDKSFCRIGESPNRLHDYTILFLQASHEASWIVAAVNRLLWLRTVSQWYEMWGLFDLIFCNFCPPASFDTPLHKYKLDYQDYQILCQFAKFYFFFLLLSIYVMGWGKRRSFPSKKSGIPRNKLASTRTLFSITSNGEPRL